MLRFLNGRSSPASQSSQSMSSNKAPLQPSISSLAGKILHPKRGNGSNSAAPELSVKSLRSLYSSLLAEISTSTAGNYIEAWRMLGGCKEDQGGDSVGEVRVCEE